MTSSHCYIYRLRCLFASSCCDETAGHNGLQYCPSTTSRLHRMRISDPVMHSSTSARGSRERAGQKGTRVGAWSPEGVAHLSQNRLMPLLIDAAASTASLNPRDDFSTPFCRIEYGQEVTSLESGPKGVVATVRGSSGEQRTIASSYAIACAFSQVCSIAFRLWKTGPPVRRHQLCAVQFQLCLGYDRTVEDRSIQPHTLKTLLCQDDASTATLRGTAMATCR